MRRLDRRRFLHCSATACAFTAIGGRFARANPADPTATERFAPPFFAFCMDTHDAKKRTLAEQASLLKELGFAGAGHLWLDQVPERLATLEAVGLELFQIYVRATLAPETPPFDPKLKEVLPLLKGRRTQIALLVTGAKPSDPAQDPRAAAVVGEIADLARDAGVRVVLYPHRSDWLDRVEDGLRLLERVPRPNLGVMFNLCHRLAVDQEPHLAGLLRQAAPRLWAVSLHGADRASEVQAGTGHWIQPLDRGSFDLLALLRLLQAQRYAGPVGLQCYGLGGDARDHLTRSAAAWRRLLSQLN